MKRLYFNVFRGKTLGNATKNGVVVNVIPTFKPFKIKVKSNASKKFDLQIYANTGTYIAKTSDGQNLIGLTTATIITFPLANTDYIIDVYGVDLQYKGFGADPTKLLEIQQ